MVSCLSWQPASFTDGNVGDAPVSGPNFMPRGSVQSDLCAHPHRIASLVVLWTGLDCRSTHFQHPHLIQASCQASSPLRDLNRTSLLRRVSLRAAMQVSLRAVLGPATTNWLHAAVLTPWHSQLPKAERDQGKHTVRRCGHYLTGPVVPLILLLGHTELSHHTDSFPLVPCRFI